MLYLCPYPGLYIRVGISRHAVSCRTQTGEIELLNRSISAVLKKSCLFHRLSKRYFRTHSLCSRFIIIHLAERLDRICTALGKFCSRILFSGRIKIIDHLLNCDIAASHDRILPVRYCLLRLCHIRVCYRILILIFLTGICAVIPGSRLSLLTLSGTW